MGDLPHPDNSPRFEAPLWPIGFAVALILIAPLILYSIAPPGPLRAGDTIFSDGQQRVNRTAASGPSTDNADPSCLLDPGNPLIILEAPTERSDGTILATVQSSTATEWPFCALHSEVIITPAQMYQKPDLWVGARSWLKGLFPTP